MIDIVLVQVLEHAKEETVSIRRLETVEEVLKESDVCHLDSHLKLHILHDSCAYVICSTAQHSTVLPALHRLSARAELHHAATAYCTDIQQAAQSGTSRCHQYVVAVLSAPLRTMVSKRRI